MASTSRRRKDAQGPQHVDIEVGQGADRLRVEPVEAQLRQQLDGLGGVLDRPRFRQRQRGGLRAQVATSARLGFQGGDPPREGEAGRAAAVRVTRVRPELWGRRRFYAVSGWSASDNDDYGTPSRV